MKTKLKAINTKDIEMELTITMTLSKWQELSAQLVGKYPSFALSNAIHQMTTRATKHFDSEPETKSY